MGLGADRVSFLAHGVGLELDEYPFITAGSPTPWRPTWCWPLNQNFSCRQIGMIGQEDTGRITPAGVEWLTHSPRGITIV